MARLFGAQILVLQAIQNSPKDSAGFVTDAEVAQSTRIALKDVRDWFETLEGEEYVEAARTESGLSASITARGRLQLGLYEPIPTAQGRPEGAGAAELAHTPSADPPSADEAVASATTSTASPLPSTTSEAGKASPPGAVDAFQVVLLIHGIRTEADWGPMVRSKLEVPGRIEVIPIKYGYFDAFRFWFPFWTRNKPVEKVYVQIRVALQKFRRDHPDAKLSIIAHSFGTYVVGQILKREFDLKIHRLILCGSVLPQAFPWHEYQGRFDDDNVVNECGKSDIWPVLAQSTSWGYGASGTHGFGSVLVKDRYHAGGHGQYFEPQFVEKYWEPFIRRGEYKGTKFETQMPPTPWRVSMLGILPLQWIVTAITLLALTLVGYDYCVKPGQNEPPANSTEQNWRLSVYKFDDSGPRSKEKDAGNLIAGDIWSELNRRQLNAANEKGKSPVEILQQRVRAPEDIEQIRNKAPFVFLWGYVESDKDDVFRVHMRLSQIAKNLKSELLWENKYEVKWELSERERIAKTVADEVVRVISRIALD
jgi:hypothetical protein